MPDANEIIPEAARFHNPPGWPRPSRRWVLEHQGMSIPAGWTPVAGLPPAPPGWTFWTLDGPAADALIAPALRRLRIWTFVGFGIAVLGLVITVSTYQAAAPGGTFVVAWGAILFGLISGIRNAVKLGGVRREFLENWAGLVAAARAELLRAEYEAGEDA